MRNNILKLKYDYAFKYILSNEVLLVSFLSSVLNINKEELTKIKILNSEIIKEKITDINGRRDLLIEVDDDYLINIELNNTTYNNHIINKSMYYLHSSLKNTIIINEKKRYISLYKKYIQINLNTFSMYEELINPFQMFLLMDPINSLVMKGSNYEIHHIDIEKCLRMCYNDINKEVTPLIRWCAIFACTTKEELNKVIGEDGFMEKSEEEKLREAWDLLEAHPWYIKEISEKEELLGIIDEQKEDLETAYEEGKNERNYEIAKNMLNKNMDINTISEITNLTEEEILKLKEEI